MNYHIYQDKNKKFEIIVTDVLSKAGGTAVVYNVQGNDDFVLKLYKDKKYALKSEAKLKQFIKGFPSAELDSMTDLPIKVHQLAWPKNIVYEKNKPVGFLMPKISFKDTVQLNRIFSIKNRKSERITEDITWRIAVARNLADVYNTLHNAGYYVVDTKPANIRTYKMVPGVCLLDCDGFKLKNSPFEGDMITPDYIAPESIGKPPAQLGREQDIFALSVLIFQLLNNGIHPYSGILNKNDTIPIQERIKKSAYAYGKVQSRVQKPSPASVHHLFPTKLLDMFSRIFEKGDRPEASEWVSILDELKKPSALSNCNKVGHRGFKKGCPTCAFEKILKDNKAPQTNKNNNAKSAAYVSSSSSLGPWGSGTNIPPQPPKNKSGNSSLKFIGVVALFLIFGLFLYNNSQENNYASNNSSNTSQTNNTTSYCNQNPRQCNNSELCKKATLGDKWEVRDDFRAYVNLAKQKGLTCGVSQYSNNNSDCTTEPTKCNNTELCKKATIAGKWEIRNHFKGYVDLAKQKGLTCGISNNSLRTLKKINISGEWRTYKCSIETTDFIGNDKYFAQFRRNKNRSILYIGIEKKQFKFGESGDLQVDSYKKLGDTPFDYQYWSGESYLDTFVTIDLSYNDLFIEQLISGYNLLVSNKFGRINVDLKGFSSAYNYLDPKNSCD